MSHSNEQLEQFKLHTHVRNLVVEKKLKAQLLVKDVDYTKKIGQLDTGFKQLQKVQQSYIKDYENEKNIGKITLEDKLRQNILNVNNLKKINYEQNLKINDLIIENKNLNNKTNTYKELNMEAIHKKARDLSKEILTIKKTYSSKKDKET